MVGDLLRIIPGSIVGMDFVGSLADVEMDIVARYFFRPPISQLLIGGWRETNIPVDLWCNIVEPVVFNPGACVGIEIIIVLHASGGIGTSRVSDLVTPGSEGADPEFDVGL